MQDYRINKVINKIASGEIRIPSFQRDYIWEPENVAFLMDSIYKGFPIGSVLFWRTSEKLDTEKQLGNYCLPEPTKNYPIDYVLDGQQRITSIFSVFQTELTPINENDAQIYFIMNEPKDTQNSRFVPFYKSDEVDLKKYFPISVLFNTVEYRKATSNLSDECIKEIDDLQEKFKDYAIPYTVLETDSKENVALVFERINRAGIPLNNFQLFNAWSWSESFDLQEQLEQLSNDLEDFEFEGLVEQQDLLLKCFTGVILGNTTPKDVMKLNGVLIRDNYNKIKTGIKSSIDFLRKELNVYSLKSLPYTSMLVPLTVFFASDKKNGELYDDKQRESLTRWFWRCCFSRRYSSGVNDVQQNDIEKMKKLRQDSNYNICDFNCHVTESFFKENQFSAGASATKTFVLMLASHTPRSFISGSKVDLAKTLKMSTSREFHHIFPDKYLQRLGFDKRKIYCLANFCFLNNADNQKIKDRAPSEYKNLIIGNLNNIMESALAPANSLNLSYEEFIKERTKILVNYANDLI